MKIYENQHNFAVVGGRFKKRFPQAAQHYDLETSKNLFSNFTLEFKQEVLAKVQSLVSDFYKLKTTQEYYDHVLSKDLVPLMPDHYHDSVLCCFDFHYNNESQELKLIEINTNASAYLAGTLLCDEDQNHIACKQLTDSFADARLLSTDQLYIIDENPLEQKMYFEFLMYKELLSQYHSNVEVIDSKALDLKLSAGVDKSLSIYNRNTDFYLEHLPHIKKAYLNQTLRLSPHPLDYDLMAKKTNLDILNKIDLKNTNLFLKSGLVRSDFNSLDELTSQKKNYYFKPSTSFGGKAVYRGANISNKYLKMVWENNMFYQQAFPADTFEDSSGQSWKYDLRFFTYKDQIQFTMARTYQGQITNFQTPGGGLAPIVFI